VRLFAERAAAAVPGFAVDERNAAAVAQIVRRLDGLPLATELAAARVRLLPLEAILERLEHSLSLLTGGSRDLPDRQQTLRATIEWSYDLLGDEARRLLAACSVFQGGVPLEVIESVCAEAGTGVTVLDGSESTELSGRLNDKVGEGMAAAFLCRSMLSSGRAAGAAPHGERAFAVLTEADDRPGIGFALFYLVLTAQFTGNMAGACDLHERCAALFEVVTCVPRKTRAWRSSHAGSVCLVRPDGYIAARGRRNDPEAVLSYLRGLSGGPAPARPAGPGTPGPALAGVPCWPASRTS
jgi:hypothetical protein